MGAFSLKQINGKESEKQNEEIYQKFSLHDFGICACVRFADWQSFGR